MEMNNVAFYTPQDDLAELKPATPANGNLPQAFLIGDSISIGYTEPTRRLLSGVCDVDRPETNCGDTRRGLALIEEWLGDGIWDVIHFNWGLHDLCHRHPDATVYGNRDKINGAISVEPAAYKVNLDKLVQIMRPKAKRLVWASTTFVPEGEAGRFQGDDARYNALAADVMAKHGIPTNDLHALTSSFPPSLFKCPGDVHYTKEGSERIAKAVAECIREQLDKLCKFRLRSR